MHLDSFLSQNWLDGDIFDKTSWNLAITYYPGNASVNDNICEYLLGHHCDIEYLKFHNQGTFIIPGLLHRTGFNQDSYLKTWWGGHSSNK